MMGQGTLNHCKAFYVLHGATQYCLSVNHEQLILHIVITNTNSKVLEKRDMAKMSIAKLKWYSKNHLVI